MVEETMKKQIILWTAVVLLVVAFCWGALMFVNIAYFAASRPDYTPKPLPAAVAAEAMIKYSGTYIYYKMNPRSTVNIYPQAKIAFNADGTFQVTSIPSKWLPDLVTPDSEIDGDGIWTMWDDGDGSMVIRFSFKTINGSTAQNDTTARVGDIMLFGKSQVNLNREAVAVAAQPIVGRVSPVERR